MFCCSIEICGENEFTCKNSGSCSLSTTDKTSWSCVCPSSHTGTDCSLVVCGSEGNACYHGGRCNETTGTCICPPPLTSDDCRGSRSLITFSHTLKTRFISRYLWCWYSEQYRLPKRWRMCFKY